MLSRHPLYSTWQGMRSRCGNPSNPQYKNYGGRGIAVCERWQLSFAAFLADMGEKPPGTSIDRIDNNGPYSPENCRWATHAEQMRNRRISVLVTHEGVTKTAEEWSRERGLGHATVGNRILRGWTPEAAIFGRRMPGKHSARRVAQAAVNGEQLDPEPLWEAAKRLVIETQTANPRWLEKHLNIGYLRAAKMLRRMEDEGVVGKRKYTNTPRQVLVRDGDSGEG